MKKKSRVFLSFNSGKYIGIGIGRDAFTWRTGHSYYENRKKNSENSKPCYALLCSDRCTYNAVVDAGTKELVAATAAPLTSDSVTILNSSSSFIFE